MGNAPGKAFAGRVYARGDSWRRRQHPLLDGLFSGLGETVKGVTVHGDGGHAVWVKGITEKAF